MILGHTSNEKLLELDKKFPVTEVVDPTSPCDICFYEKQKRLPFSLRFHVSNSVLI